MKKVKFNIVIRSILLLNYDFYYITLNSLAFDDVNCLLISLCHLVPLHMDNVDLRFLQDC